jgi:hypothetical protein
VEAAIPLNGLVFSKQSAEVGPERHHYNPPAPA